MLRGDEPPSLRPHGLLSRFCKDEAALCLPTSFPQSTAGTTWEALTKCLPGSYLWGLSGEPELSFPPSSNKAVNVPMLVSVETDTTVGSHATERCQRRPAVIHD